VTKLQRKPTVAAVRLLEVWSVAGYLSFMTGSFAAIAASRTEVFGLWCPVKAVNDSLSIAVT
jgi:hypothetical protein